MARVSEQCCDGVEAHAAVDGLGGQGVAQLVGGDGADPGGVGQMPQGLMKLLDHESMATSQRYVTAAGTETRTAATQNRLYRLLERHD